MKLFASAVMIASLTLPMVLAGHHSHGHHDDHHHDHHDEHHHHHHPYGFGYDVKDGHGNTQYRHEKSSHPHEVKGSYGYKDKHGIHRMVDYVADEHGFRAHIKTNEPGTAPKDPAAVKMDSHPVHHEHHHDSHHGHGHHDEGHAHTKHTEHHHGHHSHHPNHYAASNVVLSKQLPAQLLRDAEQYLELFN